jgi:methylase of polypeptide subunit release factors
VHAPRFAGITVYATQITTKALQAAKRTAQTEGVQPNAG